MTTTNILYSTLKTNIMTFNNSQKQRIIRIVISFGLLSIVLIYFI